MLHIAIKLTVGPCATALAVYDSRRMHRMRQEPELCRGTKPFAHVWLLERDEARTCFREVRRGRSERPAMAHDHRAVPRYLARAVIIRLQHRDERRVIDFVGQAIADFQPDAQ